MKCPHCDEYMEETIINRYQGTFEDGDEKPKIDEGVRVIEYRCERCDYKEEREASGVE